MKRLLNPGQSAQLEGIVSLGIRLVCVWGVFSLRSLGPQGQERNGFPPGSYPMKKSEWEETQGSGAIPRLPAGTSSSVICLINTPQLVGGTHVGPVRGRAWRGACFPFGGRQSALSGGLFLIQEAWMQRTSWVLVVTRRSVRGRGCWKTTRTNVMVLPLSLSVPDFSH